MFTVYQIRMVLRFNVCVYNDDDDDEYSVKVSKCCQIFLFSRDDDDELFDEPVKGLLCHLLRKEYR